MRTAVSSSWDVVPYHHRRCCSARRRYDRRFSSQLDLALEMDRVGKRLLLLG